MISNAHQINKEVNSQFLRTYPHYVLPSVNVHESDDLSDYVLEDPFPYSFSLPVPSMQMNVLAAQHEDPALALVKEKLQWKYNVKLHTDNFIKAKRVKHLVKLLEDAKKKGIASFQPREAEFVKLFSNNPDEHFNGVYNWYYTGGCMSKLELNSTTVILLSQGKKMDRVCTLSVKNDKKWQLDSNILTVATPSPNSSVFELCCGNVCGNGIIGVRSRNCCCLYSMISARKVELLHRTVSSNPFTSVDISKHREGSYCTVTTEREINVWDAESNSQIFTMTVPMPQKNFPDKWNCIYWSSSRCLVMADRYYIQMVDVRKKDIIDLFSPRMESDSLNECEMITVICPSAVSSTAMYVSTSHQVLLYDTRNSSAPLQQWTHHLRAPPLYGNPVLIEDGKEAVCFANQQLGEISLILNSCGRQQSSIKHPVVALPNMKDALRAAQRHRLWLDPTSQQRLKLSWTGMTWLPPHKSQLMLLTINSAGDVFSQVLKLKKEDQGKISEEHCGSFSDGIIINNYSTKDLKCLKYWGKHIIKSKRHLTLKSTRRIKMNHVFKSLKNSSFILSKPENDDAKSEDASRWKMSKVEMFHYKDVMAPVLLQTWEIDNENDWHVDKRKSPEAVHADTPTATQKVEAWLSVSLQNSSNLAKTTNILASTLIRKSDRIVMSDTVDSSKINEGTHSCSETQNETVSHHSGVDSKYTPIPYSTSASRTPTVSDYIFPSSTPCTEHNVLSQDLQSSQHYSSQSQNECLLSSQNTIFSTSKPRMVRKSKHISGF